MIRKMLITLLFLALPISANAQEFKKTIMTGGPNGTYIQIGKNLAQLGRNCGLNLDVQQSAGSLENLVGVRSRSNTQFGIVQSDVLDYLKTFEANDPELQRAIWGVRIMFPLYNEEVHILARRDITSVTQLDGRRVAVGKKDSGTFLTASLVLDIMRLRSVDRLAIGATDALQQLINGKIDAMFYVAGAPTKLFNDPKIDGAKFHLLQLDETPLLATYIPSRIDAGTYPFHTEPVNVVAVKAVLMTYDYKPKKNAYQYESCKAVSDFSHLMLTNMEQLKKTGHAKWNDVDLTALPPGWKVGKCVKAGMAIDYNVQCRAPEFTARVANDDEYLNLLKRRLKKN